MYVFTTKFDILEEIEKRIPGFPIVLHGSSLFRWNTILSTNMVRLTLPFVFRKISCKAAKSAVCKINIDSDGRLAMTAAVRKALAEKPVN